LGFGNLLISETFKYLVTFKVTKMKKNEILNLFFNEPSRHWHFTEITKKAGISKQQANKWLKRFLKERLIEHEKPKGKMPYFQANFSHPNYKIKKRLFALDQLYQSGLLAYLESIKKAKTVIIFGSFARSDWYTDSDIDVFIYGAPEKLETAKYWKKLHRPVQLHVFKNKKQIKEIHSGLISNMINGYLVKGDIKEVLA